MNTIANFRWLTCFRRVPVLLKRRCLSSSSTVFAVRKASAASTHNDFNSFLEYAQTSGLDRKTTVFAGTLYEYTVLKTLSSLGMTLTRIGGASDHGIDITGTWIPPSLPNTPTPRPPITIYVSCKAYRGTKNAGPAVIRELIGTVDAAPRDVDAMGIFASTKPCTAEARKLLATSRAAIGFVCITPPDLDVGEEGSGDGSDLGGILHQFIWNDAASGLLGRQLGCTARHKTVEGEEPQEEVCLTLDGVPLDMLPKPKRKRGRPRKIPSS